MPAKQLLIRFLFIVCFQNIIGIPDATSQQKATFNVLAFYTAKHDLAHISFVHEANKWFAQQAGRYHFQYDSTNDWSLLNTNNLAKYQVVIFLDTRPDD